MLIPIYFFTQNYVNFRYNCFNKWWSLVQTIKRSYRKISAGESLDVRSEGWSHIFLDVVTLVSRRWLLHGCRAIYRVSSKFARAWCHIRTKLHLDVIIVLFYRIPWGIKYVICIPWIWRDVIWQPEVIRDDFLFPMSHRLSYVSSAHDSDGEGLSHIYSDDEADFVRHQRQRQMMRSSSDPSLTTQDNIPGMGPSLPASYAGLYNSQEPHSVITGFLFVWLIFKFSIKKKNNEIIKKWYDKEYKWNWNLVGNAPPLFHI